MKTMRFLILVACIPMLAFGCTTQPPVVTPVVETVEVPVVKTVEVPVVKTVEVPVVKTVEVPAIAPGTKLEVWTWTAFVEGFDDYFLKTMDEFTRFTGVPVEVTFTQIDDLATKYNAAFEAPDTLPDVIITDGIWFPTLYEAGILADVSDVVARLNETQGGFVEGPLSSVTVDGKQYAIPWFADDFAGYKRPDVFKSAGVDMPTTYDGLLTACKAIHKPNFWCWGLNLNGTDGEWQIRSLIWSFGGSLWSADNKTVTLNSPETIAAMKYLKELGDAGAFPPDYAVADDYGNNQWWMSRQVSFISNTASVYGWMKENDTELLEMTDITLPLEGPAGRYTTMNMMPIGVVNNTEYPDLAKTLLEWLTSAGREWQYIQAANYSFLPVYKDLLNQPIYTTNRYQNSFAQTLLNAHVESWPAPMSSFSAEVMNQRVLTQMAISVLNGEATPEEAVATAQAKIEEILARHSGG